MSILQLGWDTNHFEALSYEYAAIQAVWLEALSNFNHSTPYGAMENSWCLKETRNYGHMLLYNSLINCIYQNHHCLKSITYMCLWSDALVFCRGCNHWRASCPLGNLYSFSNYYYTSPWGVGASLLQGVCIENRGDFHLHFSYFRIFLAKMRMLSLEKPVEKWETEEKKENYDWLKMN